MYEIFEHTADLGIRVRAEQLNQLFADAARGLFSVIAGDLDPIRALETIHIRLEGLAADFLLLDWLSELLFIFESRRLLLRDFTVHVDDTGLRAEARGERFDSRRHRLEHEVKAVTYHGLRVEAMDEGWLAEVIVDI